MKPTKLSLSHFLRLATARYSFLFLVSISLAVACKKTENPTPNPTPTPTPTPTPKPDPKPEETKSKVTKLVLNLSKTNILADGLDSAEMSVKVLDQNNKEMDSVKIQWFVNDQELPAPRFATNQPGTYRVYALAESIKSNTIDVISTKPVKLSKITVDPSTLLIIANGLSKVKLVTEFWDEDGAKMTPKEWSLTANGQKVETEYFNTRQAGSYDLVIKSGDISSTKITVFARPERNYTTQTLPVIFHIGHFGEALGNGSNLSKERIHDALEYTNKLFANQVSSTNPNAVDLNIRLRLAKTDPQGNPLSEPGIIRHNITSYDDGASASAYDKANDGKLGGNESQKWRNKTFWSPNEYLNVWIFPEENGSSYAGYIPVDPKHLLQGMERAWTTCLNCEPIPDDDLKTISVSTNALTKGSSTLAHEIGHALGLLHVFSPDECLTSDYCPDTYSYKFQNYTATGACPDNQGLNAFDNVMDYNGVYNTFTYDQRDRIHHVLQYGRWMTNLTRSTK